ncbi:thiamine phosphate synthase [Roseicyclus sp. F158]|uniref:Thiamine phosphate synthase n=1 Tax=Tropicimonas omnivorans TaxID=3075590 RepID=A0ABU3DJL9_9RHOB|nr:thiamine phosphate synthase [Roseicyclus sp. F158]MDT0683856.1 thiamine phosphate synthase [Roseicyclus sp. F158]
MTDTSELPQLYLVTPTLPDPDSFPDRLARVLDGAEIACVRLAIQGTDEDAIARAADAVRPVCHDADVALVVTDHFKLAERLGLDGVHLSGPKNIRAARKTLGPDAIVGAFCGASRHDGLNAGDAGADYVAFGPVGGGGVLGDGTVAERDLFAWWSEMIELPVVAEGALDVTAVRSLAPVTDFFGIGDEIWREDDPAAALARLKDAMGV